MRNKKNQQRAFSLVEVVVAMFVFTLIMTATVAIIVSAVSVRKKSKHVQQNMEDIKYAIEIMAKVIRMSSNVADDGSSHTTLYMYNNSQEKCMSYRFLGGLLESGVSNADLDNCNSSSSFSYAQIAGNITGNFVVTQSSSSPKRIGKVVIYMDIVKGSGNGLDAVKVQTTVSLRNYIEAGIN